VTVCCSGWIGTYSNPSRTTDYHWETAEGTEVAEYKPPAPPHHNVSVTTHIGPSR